MSRYIDYDSIDYRNDKMHDKPNDFIDGVIYMAQRIEEAPSIDIVRCGECKHWERLNYEAPKEGWCDDQMLYSDGRWVDADDFCSYGQKGDENVETERIK